MLVRIGHSHVCVGVFIVGNLPQDAGLAPADDDVALGLESVLDLLEELCVVVNQKYSCQTRGHCASLWIYQRYEYYNTETKVLSLGKYTYYWARSRRWMDLTGSIPRAWKWADPPEHQGRKAARGGK